MPPEKATQDPLLEEAVGLKQQVISLKNWVIALGVVVGLVFSAMVVMIFATFAVLRVATSVEEITNNTNQNSQEIKAVAQRLIDCTTPSERDPTGKITVPHPCFDALRTPVPNNNVAPIMDNVDCLFRRALAGQPPPGNINNCPAG